MNDKRFDISVDGDDGEYTIWFGHAIVMEIGYKREDTIQEYYFTQDEALAMAKKICSYLESLK